MDREGKGRGGCVLECSCPNGIFGLLRMEFPSLSLREAGSDHVEMRDKGGSDVVAGSRGGSLVTCRCAMLLHLMPSDVSLGTA